MTTVTVQFFTISTITWFDKVSSDCWSFFLSFLVLFKGGHFSCLNYAYNVRVCVGVCIQSSKNCFLALPKGKKERKNNLNAVRF